MFMFVRLPGISLHGDRGKNWDYMNIFDPFSSVIFTPFFNTVKNSLANTVYGSN
jgi:hypothetical protein